MDYHVLGTLSACQPQQLPSLFLDDQWMVSSIWGLWLPPMALTQGQSWPSSYMGFWVILTGPFSCTVLIPTLSFLLPKFWVFPTISDALCVWSVFPKSASHFITLISASSWVSVVRQGASLQLCPCTFFSCCSMRCIVLQINGGDQLAFSGCPILTWQPT